MKKQSKFARLKNEVKTSVGAGEIKYDVTVPSGTLCRNLGNRWVVQELGWLNKLSCAYHDARHRGILIDPKNLALDQVTEIESDHTR